MQADTESAVTDITITPEGQIYIFGTSMQILELLDDLNLGGPELTARLACLKPPDKNRAAMSPERTPIAEVVRHTPTPPEQPTL